MILLFTSPKFEKLGVKLTDEELIALFTFATDTEFSTPIRLCHIRQDYCTWRRTSSIIFSSWKKLKNDDEVKSSSEEEPEYACLLPDELTHMEKYQFQTFCTLYNEDNARQQQKNSPGSKVVYFPNAQEYGIDISWISTASDCGEKKLLLMPPIRLSKTKEINENQIEIIDYDPIKLPEGRIFAYLGQTNRMPKCIIFL